MALPTAPSPRTAREEPSDRRGRRPLSAMQRVALALLAVVALAGAVATAVALPEGELGAIATSLLELGALACGLTVAVSLYNRRSSGAATRPARPTTFSPPVPRDTFARPARQITFPPPGSAPIVREPRSLAPAGVATVIAAVAFAATFTLDQASRHASEAECSRSVDPQSCMNDANLPLSMLGALCALVCVAATITAVVVWLGYRRDRRAVRRSPRA